MKQRYIIGLIREQLRNLCSLYYLSPADPAFLPALTRQTVATTRAAGGPVQSNSLLKMTIWHIRIGRNGKKYRYSWNGEKRVTPDHRWSLHQRGRSLVKYPIAYTPSPSISAFNRNKTSTGVKVLISVDAKICCTRCTPFVTPSKILSWYLGADLMDFTFGEVFMQNYFVTTLRIIDIFRLFLFAVWQLQRCLIIFIEH